MQDISHWPFEVVEKDGSPMIKVNHGKVDKMLSPQEISSMVLTKMKGISEAKLGKTVNKAVITCVKFISLLSTVDHLTNSVFLLTSTTHNALLPRTLVPLLVLKFFVSLMSLLPLLSPMALTVSPRQRRMSLSLILEEELSMFRS